MFWESPTQNVIRFCWCWFHPLYFVTIYSINIIHNTNHHYIIILWFNCIRCKRNWVSVDWFNPNQLFFGLFSAECKQFWQWIKKMIIYRMTFHLSIVSKCVLTFDSFLRHKLPKGFLLVLIATSFPLSQLYI